MLGKLLTACQFSRKGVYQLLSVFKLSPGTGEATAAAVQNFSLQWRICDQMKSNTEPRNGACEPRNGACEPKYYMRVIRACILIEQKAELTVAS